MRCGAVRGGEGRGAAVTYVDAGLLRGGPLIGGWTTVRLCGTCTARASERQLRALPLPQALLANSYPPMGCRVGLTSVTRTKRPVC